MATLQPSGSGDQDPSLIRAPGHAAGAKGWRRLATVLKEAGDLEGELSALTAAVALEPDDRKLRGRLVTVLEKLGRPEDAERHRQILRHVEIQGAPPPPAPVGAPAPQPHPDDLERRALQLLAFGAPAVAESLMRRLIEFRPGAPGGWVGLRGALEAQGRTAEADAVRDAWLAAAPDRAGVVETGMGRRLTRRGMVFDPTEPIPVRPMAEALEVARSADELKTRDNVVLVLDPGGEPVERRPVLELGGAGGEGVPVRYRTGPKLLASFRHAAVIGEGVALTERGEILEELCPACDPAKYGGRWQDGHIRVEPGRYLDGVLPVRAFDTPALLMAGPTDKSFGDFIVNFAPRLALAEAAGLDCPILLRGQPQAQALDILKALGVGPERIIWHDPRRVSLFPRLYVPSWPSQNKLAPSAGVFDVYRRAAAPRPVGPRPLIYLSRQGVQARPLANEEQVCALFASRGFRIVDPGRLSFEEVRALFCDPACVAGPFGSAFHNLVFTAGRPVSLVLMPTHLPVHLAEMALWQGDLGLRFAYVPGDIPPGPHGTFTPWTVPLDRVERALDRVLELIAQGGEEPGPGSEA